MRQGTAKSAKLCLMRPFIQGLVVHLGLRFLTRFSDPEPRFRLPFAVLALFAVQTNAN